MLAAECCKYRAILRQILRSLEILTANDQHMIHRYFHTEVLSQRRGFTQAFYTYTCFYPGMVLHANTFMRRCFYTGMFLIQKSNYTQTRGQFYTQMPLHSDVFTEECFYTHVRLHRASLDNFFSFCTQKFDIKYSYAEMFFTQRNICTKASF